MVVKVMSIIETFQRWISTNVFIRGEPHDYGGSSMSGFKYIGGGEVCAVGRCYSVQTVVVCKAIELCSKTQRPRKMQGNATTCEAPRVSTVVEGLNFVALLSPEMAFLHSTGRTLSTILTLHEAEQHQDGYELSKVPTFFGPLHAFSPEAHQSTKWGPPVS